MADTKKVVVTRFEVRFESGAPTTSRLIAYTGSDDRHGYAIGTTGKRDSMNKLMKATILALAGAWPDTPDNVTIEVNKDQEIVNIVVS
jgi:hypothetical protein